MYGVIYCVIICFIVFFFFKQKTAYEMRISDWSSDVCSSDLALAPAEEGARKIVEALGVVRRAEDQHVGLEPYQRSLVVIILAARPAREGLGLARHAHRVERRDLHRPPLTPRLEALVNGVGRPFGQPHPL